VSKHVLDPDPLTHSFSGLLLPILFPPQQVVEEVQVLTDFRSALKRRTRKQQLMQQQYPSHYGHLQETEHRPAAAAAAVRPLFMASRALPHPAREQQQVQQLLQPPRALVLNHAMGHQQFSSQC
jgi:hypothetical protein